MKNRTGALIVTLSVWCAVSEPIVAQSRQPNMATPSTRRDDPRERGPDATTNDEARASTRAELWRQRREEKRRNSIPDEPHRIEAYLLAMEKAERPSFLDANFHGFYPRIQVISRGSNLGLGARYWRPDFAGALDIHGSAFRSVSGYEYLDLQAGLLPHRGKTLPLRSWKGDDVYEIGNPDRDGLDRIQAYTSMRRRHLPKEDFFGLGPDSKRDDRTSYLLDENQIDAVVGWTLFDGLNLSVRAGIKHFETSDGDDGSLPGISTVFSPDEAPGLGSAINFKHVTPSLLIDFRDQPGNPHRGGMLAVSYARYFAERGFPNDFERLALDARAFIPLGSTQRIAALRFLGFRDRALNGGQIPFYLQESLGGSHTFRGFDSFRFRGETLALYQLEYRWEAAPAWELALFVDAGKVASQGFNLGQSNLEVDYGLGIRFKTHRTVFLRFDIAWSDERVRTLIRFSSSY